MLLQPQMNAAVIRSRLSGVPYWFGCNLNAPPPATAITNKRYMNQVGIPKREGALLHPTNIIILVAQKESVIVLQKQLRNKTYLKAIVIIIATPTVIDRHSLHNYSLIHGLHWQM